MRLTVDEAVLLQDDLLQAYSADEVQQKMREIGDMVRQGKEEAALQEKSAFLLEIQKPIVAKHGFEASMKGVNDAMLAFTPDDVNRDPAVFRRNNRLEQKLCGGLPLDSYFTSWNMIQLRNLGVYRELPENRFPVVECTEPKRMSHGRIGKTLRPGILDAEETDKLVAACKKSDVAAASQLLGSRKVGASAKAVLANVGYRALGPAGASTLAKGLGKDLESLELDISGNSIGPEGAKAIAGKLGSSLKTLKLNLSNNHLTTEGVKAIMAALPQSVEVLNLGFAGMKMGEAGAAVIAQHMPKQVRELTLDLFGNNIGDEGVIGISRAFPKTLEYLNIMLLDNLLSRRGMNVIDRQIGDPLNLYHLPKLTNEMFKKTAEIEIYEFKEDEDGHLVRQLDWRSNF